MSDPEKSLGYFNVETARESLVKAITTNRGLEGERDFDWELNNINPDILTEDDLRAWFFYQLWREGKLSLEEFGRNYHPIKEELMADFDRIRYTNISLANSRERLFSIISNKYGAARVTSQLDQSESIK